MPYGISSRSENYVVLVYVKYGVQNYFRDKYGGTSRVWLVGFNDG